MTPTQAASAAPPPAAPDIQVVAMSMPIVYTLEGDHDPNGMAYVLKPVHQLLTWAKACWKADDELLPRLHMRRQRAQLVTDGLERLEIMLDRLLQGNEDDQVLLAELMRRETVPGYGDPEDRERPAGQLRGGRQAAVRTNVQRQLDDLRFALAELGARVPVDGPAPAVAAQARAQAAGKTAPAALTSTAQALAAAPTDPAQRRRRWLADRAFDRALANEQRIDQEARLRGWPVADDAAEANADAGTDDEDAADAGNDTEIPLVTLSPAQRAQLRAHWLLQSELLDRAIERCLAAQDSIDWSDPAQFPAGVLAAGIPAAWVRRLLLNDHKHPSQRHLPPNRFNPMKPIPALRPLVLRVHVGQPVIIEFENQLKHRAVGFHVQGGGMSLLRTDANSGLEIACPGVKDADGACIGANNDSTCAPGARQRLRYAATHEGVWPINDLADVRGSEAGTNAHGLFGALIVEPAGTRWRDPESGDDLTDVAWNSLLDVDIIASGEDRSPARLDSYVDLQDGPRSFREFTVFIHDQPEVHSGLHTVGEHSIMPLSYRAEPMHNRLPHRLRHQAALTAKRPPPADPDAIDRTAVTWRLGPDLEEQFLTARNAADDYLEYIAGEEQHHSSWLFGDPVTHIQRAYRGDPCRVRLVHAGVKETHIYHLHVHQWRAVAADSAPPSQHGTGDGHKGSQLLDSITIGPQCGMTIDPLYGSGSRQHAIGDIIWHCHLYPHFHHGMWGLWRSYGHRVDGSRPYPDGSHCPPLVPLPGRNTDAGFEPTLQQPGFPWFIDGEFPMKSPPPPLADGVPASGRRVLLRMPRASVLERAAMHPNCADGRQPGALFVDLDGLAAHWNQTAHQGQQVSPLSHPRIISYDVEVRAGLVTYNADGWHDPRGHMYRLTRAEIREWRNGGYEVTVAQDLTHAIDANPQPLYPRANHGDIVEWRQHNSLGHFAADQFDHGQLPVEVGLHVHLVKFDPLAADGSSTGWNYLSGASCRDAVGADGLGELRAASLHRWVVDEEFGPCFFHDHLLANFRQKHGLFSALIAEPHGAQWTRVDDQSAIAWGDPQAVVLPPVASGLPPYREVCLGICDFVALLDVGGRALNPPSNLSGDDDPGAMAVNYRSAPLTFRGRDPSQWFSNSARSRPNLAGVRGEPDTPLVQTYPGERLRIRLVQGSHEEQHGFALHGMRWRRDWGHPGSPFANQQTLGISEAFTLDINPEQGESPYGVGDHLYHFCALDDIWLGCWGIVRALPPVAANFNRLAPLPRLGMAPAAAQAAMRHARATPPQPASARDAGVRSFLVLAQRVEHAFAGTALTDPWGLTYRVLPASLDEIEAARDQALDDEHWSLTQAQAKWVEAQAADTLAPLVLRARAGEWVRVVLVNQLVDDHEHDDHEDDGAIAFGVEPSPARLPLEHLDAFHRPDRRTVSTRVSLHASLLRYDVRQHDGSLVGDNPDSTVGSLQAPAGHGQAHGGGDADGNGVVHRPDHHGRRNWREVWWYVDDKLAPASVAQGPGQVCFLHDMADIRNHRHHGLVGALIVEAPDATPRTIAKPGVVQTDAWSGLNAEIHGPDGQTVAYETAVFVQDGLRLFVNGNPELPLPDLDPTDDPEDSGQKGINYRSHPVHHGQVSAQTSTAFPLAACPAGSTLWLRLLGAGDKPRQHTMTVHGCAWPLAPWVNNHDRGAAVTGLSPCRAETVVCKLSHAGDHAVRAGAFRWASEHGVWASVRVNDPPPAA